MKIPTTHRSRDLLQKVVFGCAQKGLRSEFHALVTLTMISGLDQNLRARACR